MAAKGEEREFVRCAMCRHATFMQWFQNPIVADCHHLNERMVAESRRVCKFFEPSGAKELSDITIQHFDHYDM